MLPWIIAAALLILSFALLLRLHALRQAADEIRETIGEILSKDTNILLSVSTLDKKMRSLAAALNHELRALRKERRRLQNGDRELKEAITNIAHDLRTPLTAISGYLDLLEESRAAENPETSRYLAIIRERTEALKTLTEELFRYSVITLSSEKLQIESVSLNRALEESLAGYYAALTGAGITPNISLPEETVTRSLDPRALRRIFGNILNNAVKYSEGDLAVALKSTGEITFRNRAPSLNAVQAEKLFDRFYTVETGRNATGLGLSIAKILTEEMGGKISAAYDNDSLTLSLCFPADSTH